MIDKGTFYTEMCQISEMDSEEERHILADELLCKALRRFGYGEGVEVFEKMEKWYA